MHTSTRTLEFWFDFSSNYSYLSVMRIEALARQAAIGVLWKPILLGAIFKSLGQQTSPFVLQQQKGAYVWNDMRRQCEKYGLPWRRPSVFPRSSVLAARVALIGADEGWIAPFSQRMMTLNFALDRDIGDAENVSAVLTEMGLETEDVIARALSPDNKQRLRSQTEEARQRGIFGAPSFIGGGELFWGNDRLEDALRYAAPPAT
ncbi:2-hydroxychromene-2-carboxylate isomerase [Janthinobacterium agaricidamnosum]|uniref:2-hydroxychromene-2-carboxylate isomerase n=1 Tax=Janthinobacterium agaricidamnosum NBRC 102515 = DSM 9628 TaxID=1349767 RepID=W0V296_9BURK|nr:2-hydroxychromene-2-carboxylate isomerase [Janthinobacterium agaricidamnosum]CDG81986.1 DSBA-like thioredoxin domain protein [Janthinobacterium agaricidamnosum NBRC 102515 = DSM 9628]